VPRLIHLNGPSGIGKSTIARCYAEGHPGVLDLAMAEAHPRTGHDVVMPQRPGCVVVRTDGRTPEQTYDEVVAVL
jgi:hypothetical protein